MEQRSEGGEEAMEGEGEAYSGGGNSECKGKDMEELSRYEGNEE